MVTSEDAPVRIVDPDDDGTIAAYILSQEDPGLHNKAKYVLNGPEDITGTKILKMVEQYTGEPFVNVCYKETTFIDQMTAATHYSRNVILSIKYAPNTAWEGKCTASMTSKEILELAAPNERLMMC